jgi:hypothetical protein
MLHLDYNKVDVPNLVLILIEHLYWSGMWFGVAPKTDTKKRCVLKESGCVLNIYDNHYELNGQYKFKGRRGYTTTS